MPTQRTSGVLQANIAADLADNNAGLISAADLRNNLADTVASINIIVASGNTNTDFPFTYDVRAQIQDPNGSPHAGRFIAESGILFPNAVGHETDLQTAPYLGDSNIDHNALRNLTVGDVHTQYYPIDGSRNLTGNLPAADKWIGPSGHSNEGFKFEHTATGIKIYTSGTQIFGDLSKQSSAKGIAKAWLNFDASGVGNVPVVRSSYNIYKLERLAQGKFRITFNSGTFKDNNYVAVGNSNSTTASGSREDFANNAVGLVIRDGDDGTALRSITYVIRNDQDQYVDGKINDFVAYGLEPGATADSSPIIVGL